MKGALVLQRHDSKTLLLTLAPFQWQKDCFMHCNIDLQKYIKYISCIVVSHSNLYGIRLTRDVYICITSNTNLYNFDALLLVVLLYLQKIVIVLASCNLTIYY